MQSFVPDHLETKKMFKYVFKKLPFVIRCAPDWYKTKKVPVKVILENSGILKAHWQIFKKIVVWKSLFMW